MPNLSPQEIRILRLLEEHPRLDELQVAGLAELPVSVAQRAIEALVKKRLIIANDGLYALDSQALAAILETA